MRAIHTVRFEGIKEKTLGTQNFQQNRDAPSQLRVIEEEESTEIKYEEVPEDPHSVFGPSYPPSTFVPEKNKVENPKYDPNYGKSHGYNYIDANGIPITVDVKLQDLDPPSPPPIPTSEIPYSQKKSVLDAIFIFMFHYWYYFLIGIGALVAILVGLLVVFLVVKSPKEDVSSTTTSHPTFYCREGFTKVGSKCWSLSITGETWTDAKKICRSSAVFSHLVTINNAEENTLFGQFIGKQSSAWLGLYCDSESVQPCKWDDGTEYSTQGYNNFGVGNSLAGGGCVYYSSQNGWLTGKCELDTYSVVCEETLY